MCLFNPDTSGKEEGRRCSRCYRYYPTAHGEDVCGISIPCSLWRGPWRKKVTFPEGTVTTLEQFYLLCSLLRRLMLEQGKSVRWREWQRGAAESWPQPLTAYLPVLLWVWTGGRTIGKGGVKLNLEKRGWKNWRICQFNMVGFLFFVVVDFFGFVFSLTIQLVYLAIS